MAAFVLSRQMLLILSVLVFIVVSGCSDIESPQIGSVPPDQILYQVRMSTNTVMMQRGDSLQLSPLAISSTGSELDVNQADYITWSTTNGDIVTVDSTGLIKGIANTPSLPVNVSVSLKYGLVTKSHSIPVYITDSKIEISKIKLISLDSTRISYTPSSGGGVPIDGGGRGTTPPRIQIEAFYDGEPVIVSEALPLEAPVGVIFNFDRDAQIYRVLSGSRNIGKFMIRLSGNLYGNEVSDSLEFESVYYHSKIIANPGFSWTVLFDPINGVPPLYARVETDSVWRNTVSSNNIVLQKCAVVYINGGNEESIRLLYPEFRYPPLDIVFDDSANVSDCDSGNVDTSKYLEVLGGNVYNWSKSDKGVVRKSSAIGEVEWHVRDATTKEILFNGRYVVKEPEV